MAEVIELEDMNNLWIKTTKHSKDSCRVVDVGFMIAMAQCCRIWRKWTVGRTRRLMGFLKMGRMDQ